MNSFILVSIVLALTGEYLAIIGFPGPMSFATELCSIAATVLLVAHLAKQGVPQVRTAYVVILSLLTLHILFGILANHVQVGTVLVGSRIYFRAIPFFLLAIAAPPKNNELVKILTALVLLGIMQLPIAISQRLATMARDTTHAKYLTTGDWTVGTFSNAAMLSIFLISIASIVFAAFLRKRIRAALAVSVIVLLLIPTMINETKATIFLIPLAFLMVAVFHSSGSRRRAIATSLVAITVFTIVFIPTYDYFMKPRWGYGLMDFFAMEGRVENYLDKGAEVGTTEKVGRIDSFKLPIQTLKRDPVSLGLGLGIGNVTESVFGDSYSGAYYRKYGNLLGPTVSRLLWELGIIGVVLVFCLLFLIYKHALALRARNDTVGVIAHAWVGVLPIFVVGMFYKELIYSPGLSVVFWYLSGVIIAHSGRLGEPVPDRSNDRVKDNPPVAGTIA